MTFSSNEQGVVKVRNFSIVFKTIYKESIKTKSFLNVTIGLVLLSFLLFASPTIISYFDKNKSTDTYKIVNETELPLSIEELSGFDGKWELTNPDNINMLKEDVKNEDVSGLFVLVEKSNQIQLDVYMPKVNQELLLTLKAYIEQTKIESLAATESIDSSVLQALNTPVLSQIQPLYETEPNAILIIYGLIAIMFLAISTYGNNVATAIASEKSSRVMEVMITKVAPIPMMYGKILGIGLASLTQLFVFIGSLFVWSSLGIFNVPEGSIVHTVMDTITWETASYIFVFFIMGYFIYATLFAIIGSMVSRPDDLSSATMPIVIILMASLVVEMIFVMDYPDGKVAIISSYIPFTAPMSVLVRIVYHTISSAEIVVTLAVMMLFIALFAAFAARIYPKGVLKSDTLTFKQLIRINR